MTRNEQLENRKPGISSSVAQAPPRPSRRLDDDNVQARTGEVGGANQAVVARADNDDVMHTAARNSKGAWFLGTAIIVPPSCYSATFMFLHTSLFCIASFKGKVTLDERDGY